MKIMYARHRTLSRLPRLGKKLKYLIVRFLNIATIRYKFVDVLNISSNCLYTSVNNPNSNVYYEIKRRKKNNLTDYVPHLYDILEHQLGLFHC